MNGLQRESESLKKGIQSRREELAAGTETSKKYTKLLGQNSHSSSTPPSRNKSRQPNPKRRRKRSNHNAGGQKGHRDQLLEPQTKLDAIVIYPSLGLLPTAPSCRLGATKQPYNAIVENALE